MPDDLPHETSADSRQRALSLLNEAIRILDDLKLTSAAARLSFVIDEVKDAELD
jgi:hypothetical protein